MWYNWFALKKALLFLVDYANGCVIFFEFFGGYLMSEVKTSKLPTLPLKTIWMLSFGYLGVQMAFSLQSSNMGRIFETLGADPTRLGFFFILPPKGYSICTK